MRRRQTTSLCQRRPPARPPPPSAAVYSGCLTHRRPSPPVHPLRSCSEARGSRPQRAWQPGSRPRPQGRRCRRPWRRSTLPSPRHSRQTLCQLDPACWHVCGRRVARFVQFFVVLKLSSLFGASLVCWSDACLYHSAGREACMVRCAAPSARLRTGPCGRCMARGGQLCSQPVGFCRPPGVDLPGLAVRRIWIVSKTSAASRVPLTTRFPPLLRRRREPRAPGTSVEAGSSAW